MTPNPGIAELLEELKPTHPTIRLACHDTIIIIHNDTHIFIDNNHGDNRITISHINRNNPQQSFRITLRLEDPNVFNKIEQTLNKLTP